jgi:hypothetical protein
MTRFRVLPEIFDFCPASSSLGWVKWSVGNYLWAVVGCCMVIKPLELLGGDFGK